jgi:hypothetical protein
MDDHERVMSIIRMKSQAPAVLDQGRTALLIIDMQRDFVHSEYEFAQALERLAPGVTEGKHGGFRGGRRIGRRGR